MLGKSVRFVRWPGVGLGDDAMTLFNETRSAIRTLCAAIVGYAQNCCAQLLTGVETSHHVIIAGSPDRRIAGSPDRRIAGSPDRRIARPASSARDCSRPLASPPESSDSFDPSPARASAGSRPAARRLRCGLFSALLCLPLLLGLAAPAAAQSLSGETRIDSHSVSEDGNTFTVDWSYFVTTLGWIDGGTSAGLWEYHVRENGGAHTATEIGASATSVITFTLSSSASGRLVEVRIRHKSTSTNSAWTTVQDNRVADTTAPSVTSITRQSPSSSPTNADSVKWRVTFDEAVQNVDAGDFQVSGTALTITVVSPVTGSETTTYDVTVSSGNLAGLDGTVTLSFASGHNIQDMAGNALASSPSVSGTNDNSYVVDNTAPGVTSITRQTPATSPTGADSLIWRVTFDEAVQHVNEADFQVSGTTATITAVSPVTGSETTTYAVTATGGDLAGLNATVTLSFASGHNIEDMAGNSLATSPTVSGTNDNTFVVQNTATSVTVSISAPANANEGSSGTTDKHFTITLSSALTQILNVDVCYSGTATHGASDDYQFLATSTVVPGIGASGKCRSFQIPAGDTTLSGVAGIRINGDTDAEYDETVIATLSLSGSPPTGVTLGTSTATYTIQNDDGTPIESIVSITGGHEVREGRGAEFTLTANPARAADTVVNINVTETGTFLAGSPGTRTVTIPSGQTSHTFTVATVNDGGRDAFGQTQGKESNGSVTATVNTGMGYTLGSPFSATVNILDDDTNAGSGNYIRVSGHGARIQNENDRGSRHFRVSRYGLPTATTGDWGFKLCFAGTATPGVDYTLDTHFREEAGIAINADGCTAQRTIPGGDDRYHFYISHVDDPHAEGTETIVVTVTGLNNVFFSDQPGINIIRFTIVDDDTPAPPKPDQQAERAELETAEAQAPACVSDALLADAQLAATETWRTSPGHVERWSRVLAAFGVSNGYSPMTVAEAQAQADRGLQRWAPVAPALECLENPPQEEQPEQAEVQPVTPATPELSLSAGSAVDEGGHATFTVTADPAPQSDLTIAWTVAQSGEYLAAPGAGSRTVVLTAGTTSTALSVGTVDDAADEADGSVSVTLGAGTGYTIATGKGSAVVAVRDNDEPVVSIAAGSGVTEGAAASFTVSASPVPAAPLDVTLAVAQSGDFAASGETGSRTVSVPVTGSVTFDVTTDDDSAEEPDGSITATVDAGTGYAVAASPDNAATVAVSDNDAASSGPTISIADATFNENAGTVHFTVTLSEPVDHRVTVHYATRSSSPISARAGQDYFEWKRAWGAELWIPAGSTKGRIAAYIYNDSHDEDPETFEMVLFDASDGVSIADGVAVGTIVNDDPMPAAWLARFGRTVAEQALDGIAGRIAAPRTAGVEGTFAGQALNLDPGSQADGPAVHGATGSLAGTDMLAENDVAFTGTGGTAEFGDDALGFDSASGQSYAMTTAEVLLGSSFTATGEEDSHGGSLALWGRAAQSHFDGREGTFSLDGEATTAMLGADYARGTWLLGMALMQSTGEGGYRDTDPGENVCDELAKVAMDDMDDMNQKKMKTDLCDRAVRDGDGTVEATLTAVLPYAAVQASERLKLWGAAGYGTGDVTLKTEMGEVLTSDITWTMGAAGMRGDVITAQEGPALAVTSDALWARTSSAKTHELAASDSDVTRLRLGLEGSWRMALEGGGSVTPKLETGARHDGGDAETGFGVEMGGGLVWNDPGLGLQLDLSGRTLVAHGSDDLEDRGFAASLAFDPDPASARGPSLTLRQDWGGEATGGLDRLFTPETLEDRTGGAEDEIRWQAQAAYGFPLFSGAFTGSPQAGLGLATGVREYSLGWQLTPGEGVLDLSFGLRATRRESEGAPAAHGAGLETTLRW